MRVEIAEGRWLKRRVRTDQRGAAAIEYALLAALIALALLGALMGTGSNVEKSLAKVPPALADDPETEFDRRN